MKKTRLLASLLAVPMIIGAISACGENTTTSSNAPPPASGTISTADSSEKEDDESETKSIADASAPVTLKMYVGNPGFNQSGWGTDIVSSTIIEKTGVTLEFDISAEAENQKLQLLISSDDLPDITLIGHKSVHATSMIENGRVFSLDELSELYDPEYMESDFMVGNRQYLESSIDGKVYGVPSEFTDRNKLDDGVFLMPAPGYYYRKDLHDAIGAPPLETPDDIAAAATLAYEQDPMGLNHALFLWDPTGVGSEGTGLHVLYYAMGGQGKYYETNGKLESKIRDPIYKETLLFVNKLVNDGVINPSDFTDLPAQQEVINNETGYFMAVGPYWRALVPHDQLPLENPGVEIDVIRPIKKPDMDQAMAPVTGLNGWDQLFVGKNTEYPEECFNFVKYMLSDEGQLLVTAGIEDEHWAWGGPDNNWVTLIGEAKDQMTSSWNDWVGFLGTYTYQWGARNYYDSALCWGLAIDDEFKAKVYEYENCGTDASAYEDIDPVPGSDEDVIRVKYMEVWKSYIARICTAGSEEEAEKLYDELITTLDQQGLATLEDVWTENYKKRNAE